MHLFEHARFALDAQSIRLARTRPLPAHLRNHSDALASFQMRCCQRPPAPSLGHLHPHQHQFSILGQSPTSAIHIFQTANRSSTIAPPSRCSCQLSSDLRITPLQTQRRWLLFGGNKTGEAKVPSSQIVNQEVSLYLDQAMISFIFERRTTTTTKFSSRGCTQLFPSFMR